MGHKFCGRCGGVVPGDITTPRTHFYGQLQTPGKAKLILIRGEGMEGVSYQLEGDEHEVGRAGQVQFADDPTVSERHANFFYRDGALVVRDEASTNGVFVRVRGPVRVDDGDMIIAGDQVLRVERSPVPDATPDADNTVFYGSPRGASVFRITQMLSGGAPGITVCARGTSLQVGREGADLNFPSDSLLSVAHLRIEDTGDGLQLTDLGSRNGTFLRIRAEHELVHGDYVFIGRKLLRVEVNAA